MMLEQLDQQIDAMETTIRSMNLGRREAAIIDRLYEIYSLAEAALNQPMKRVKVLTTGEEIEIPVDTPRCCDPSTELYWSM
jgi:hypothetical protein